MNNFDKWENLKAVTVSETATALGTDEMVINRSYCFFFYYHFSP